ncbi:immune inhibitor A domain-containing protein [Gottfriedia acidiceleris]|uniref:immune inhibitor A domain-containing protein n=1 Tax=Bacillaceae TaxID=186817 RepID=UPI000BED67DD|nr:immune inhibitor A domain-containing protein [Bacillus sp. AFS096315]PEC48142.1 peptidase M6 [Bacillus sp. AFS096315]
MKFKKSIIAVLSTSFILSGVAGKPTASFAEKQSITQKADWGVINKEALKKYLVDSGLIDEKADPQEVEKAIQEYVANGKTTPFSETEGIDTSSEFGLKVYKGKKAVQKHTEEKIAKIKEETHEKSTTKKEFVDNAVVALIEFPDFHHNKLPDPENDPIFQYFGIGNSLWVPDFNQEHYKNLIFNPDGYKDDKGRNFISVEQYYNQQSAGYWHVDGEVTPWVMAKNDMAYYGAHEGQAKDAKPQELVRETLEVAGKQIAGNEAKYDQRDPYDLDEDGNTMEPDGLLDNLLIVHSGPDEAAGGGSVGANALWSHRSVIGAEPIKIPGTNLKAYDYIMQPENGAAGVFAHEYGHNLGLPDEYDTGYTGKGSPVENWSIMSSGSWSGKIPGTEPTGFSPFAKLFFYENYGGNWPKPTVIDFSKLEEVRDVKLKEAVADSNNEKILKINLPDVLKDAPTKPLGTKSYFSTKGDMLNTSMTSPVIELTNTSHAKLTFDSWRDIESDYDYLYVNVYEEGSTQPVQIKAFSDTTNHEWVKDEIDVSQFAGKKIKIEFQYVTDMGLAKEGFYVDNIKVEADDRVIFEDNAETSSQFTLNGFKEFDGAPVAFPNYYLVEYRTHNGVDKSLAYSEAIPYDPGMVVWYYDGSYGEDNMTGSHPGHGFLGIVDAHQDPIYKIFSFGYGDGKILEIPVLGETPLQIADAAFGLLPTSKYENTGFDWFFPYKIKLDSRQGISTFNDQNDYSTPFNPSGGKILPKNGVQIDVLQVDNRKNEVQIQVSKKK